MKLLLLLPLFAILLVSGCTVPGDGLLSNITLGNGTTQDNQTTPPPEPKTVNVDITAGGFSPKTVNISVGDTVVFTNKNSAFHWPASNPHPTHTDLAGFDSRKGLKSGDTYSFTFTRRGTFGFHDHLNPLNTGTVVVE